MVLTLSPFSTVLYKHCYITSSEVTVLVALLRCITSFSLVVSTTGSGESSRHHVQDKTIIRPSTTEIRQTDAPSCLSDANRSSATVYIMYGFLPTQVRAASLHRSFSHKVQDTVL